MAAPLQQLGGDTDRYFLRIVGTNRQSHRARHGIDQCLSEAMFPQLPREDSPL